MPIIPPGENLYAPPESAKVGRGDGRGDPAPTLKLPLLMEGYGIICSRDDLRAFAAHYRLLRRAYNELTRLCDEIQTQRGEEGE